MKETVLFRAKVFGLVDGVEDPRETLAYACHRQEELLADVRRSLIEVSASKHQLAAQILRLDQRVPQLEDQARRAVAASREDLARQALERRQSAGPRDPSAGRGSAARGQAFRPRHR